MEKPLNETIIRYAFHSPRNIYVAWNAQAAPIGGFDPKNVIAVGATASELMSQLRGCKSSHMVSCIMENDDDPRYAAHRAAHKAMNEMNKAMGFTK